MSQKVYADDDVILDEPKIYSDDDVVIDLPKSNNQYGPPLPPSNSSNEQVETTPQESDDYSVDVMGNPTSEKAVNQAGDFINSSGRGLAAGSTFGNSDELAGGAEALWHLAHGSTKEGFTELYKKYRDEQRIKNKIAETNHPYLYGGSKALGTVGSSLLLPGGVVSAGLQGAATGLGESNSEDIGGLARDTAVGGVVGSAIGAALPAAGKLVSKAGSSLKSLAEDAAEGAAGGAKVGATKYPEGTGRKLLNEKIVSFWDNPTNIAKKAAQAENKAINYQNERFKGVDPSLESSIKTPQSPLSQIAKQSADKANQASSPIGDAMDLAIGGGGAIQSLMSHNLLGAGVGVAGAGLRRLAAPRLESSGAVGADVIGSLLQKSPELFGKYAKPLINAAARGGSSLASNIFVLQQRDAGFRQIYNQIQDMIDVRGTSLDEQNE